MLELIRKYKPLFMVVFVISAIGMVVSLFGTGSDGAGGAGLMLGGTAAKVESEEISSRELLQALQQQVQMAEERMGGQFKGEEAKFMMQLIRAQITPDRVLQQLIQQRFLITTADSLGIKAPPEAIRALIEQNPAFHTEGKFDPVLYKQTVQQPALYEQQLARQAKYTLLSQAFEAGVGVLSTEEKIVDKQLGRRLQLEALRIDPAQLAEPASVSEDEKKAFLASADATAKLQSYYNRNIAKFRTEEEVHARHVLIDDKAGGEAKAKEVLADIKAKKISFEDAAKKYSTDKSNADKGGDLGFFSRGKMVPEFEKAAFELRAPNDLTAAPVKTSFGYHLIQLIERKAGSSRSLETVKNEIAGPALLEIKRGERAQALAKSWAESGKAPDAATLKKLKLSWKTLPEWSPTDPSLGDLGEVDDKLGEILALSEKNPLVKKPLQVGEGWALVRFVKEVPTKAAVTGPVAELAHDAERKTQDSFEFYLQARLKELENKKKIIRSEKILNELRNALKSEQG